MLFSEEAEGSLIARALVEPRQIPLLTLSPDDFYLPDYRKAWAAMQRMSDAGKSIDIATLRAEGVELPDPLGRLTAGHRAPLEDYARIIAGHAFQRRVITALDTATRRATETTDQARLIADVQEAVAKILHGVSDGKLHTSDAAIDEFLADWQKHRVGVPYGFPALDKVIQPPEPGDLIIVAARPSVGKTIFAEQVADNLSEGSEHPVLFASIEMSRRQLIRRAISRYGDIDATSMVRGILTAAEVDAAKQTLEARRNIRLYYLDHSGANSNDVMTAAARVRLMHGGISGIVIDYIGLLTDAGDQEVQRIGKISRKVKQMAREMECPVIALSQLNRQTEYREDKRPRLSDLRDSGSLEQDADVVLGLWAPTDTTREILVLKNRGGPSGMAISARFTPNRVRYD